jgi:hypothetical protein
MLTFGPMSLDIAFFQVGAQLNTVQVVHFGGFAPELYVELGRMRIGFGLMPEFLIGFQSVGTVGSTGECDDPNGVSEGTCESRRYEDEYFEIDGRRYDAEDGADISGYGFAFGLRPYVRMSLDITDSIGIALVGGYRFFGQFDNFRVGVAEDEQDTPRYDIPDSVYGGTLGSIDAGGLGVSFEVFYFGRAKTEGVLAR